jgi:hypothetical protein
MLYPFYLFPFPLTDIRQPHFAIPLLCNFVRIAGNDVQDFGDCCKYGKHAIVDSREGVMLM